MANPTASFNLLEATIDDIHSAYKSGQLSVRQLVQMYLYRIEAYDKKGPAINAIISVNSHALEEADQLDAKFKASGFVGPLHGIPIIIKDQADAKGMPTTLGSVLFRNYYPDRDAFVVEKLKKAGAIILAKSTLGELGGGDTHGSLFGSHFRWLFRRLRGERGGKFLRRRGRTGRLRIDPQAIDLEFHHRHAADGRFSKSRRCLCRVAFSLRISGAHGPHCKRFGEVTGRLRSGRSTHRKGGRPCSRQLHKIS